MQEHFLLQAHCYLRLRSLHVSCCLCPLSDHIIAQEVLCPHAHWFLNCSCQGFSALSSLIKCYSLVSGDVLIAQFLLTRCSVWLKNSSWLKVKHLCSFLLTFALFRSATNESDNLSLYVLLVHLSLTTFSACRNYFIKLHLDPMPFGFLGAIGDAVALKKNTVQNGPNFVITNFFQSFWLSAHGFISILSSCLEKKLIKYDSY